MDDTETLSAAPSLSGAAATPVLRIVWWRLERHAPSEGSKPSYAIRVADLAKPRKTDDIEFPSDPREVIVERGSDDPGSQPKVIRLAGDEVSRPHARLFVSSGDELWVEAIKSKNGTIITRNEGRAPGLRILERGRAARLHSGSVVRLATWIGEVTFESSAEQRASASQEAHRIVLLGQELRHAGWKHWVDSKVVQLVPSFPWFEDPIRRPQILGNAIQRCERARPEQQILQLEHIVWSARLPVFNPGDLEGGRRIWTVLFDRNPPFEIDTKGTWFLHRLVGAPYQRLLAAELMREYQSFYSPDPRALPAPARAPEMDVDEETERSIRAHVERLHKDYERARRAGHLAKLDTIRRELEAIAVRVPPDARRRRRPRASENARTAAWHAINAAIDAIEERNAELAARLAASIHRGNELSFNPGDFWNPQPKSPNSSARGEPETPSDEDGPADPEGGD